jgi:ATP-dependent Lhr-like helicase
MQRWVIATPRLTPFAFPIWADRLRTQVSSEDWTDRVQRMLDQLEDAAPAGAGEPYVHSG